MSDIESFDGDALTSQCVASDLRKSGHVVIKGRPCKIVDISTSRTGKHGHTKSHVVGIDIFTGKKYEDIVASSQSVDVPIVHRNEYSLDGAEDGYLVLKDADGNSKTDVPMPEHELGNAVSDYLESGDACTITVVGAMNEQACVGIKDA
ncbi:hypothetical protein ASPWEDRAFT_46160 [Aspergillus wentii DTO 134E9]|uniref:Eukaryotic translation initiation factor 5A n=1 Tax=Aspergillus wentii DTO 134E9 TaxID=1073089 RepID=A0A1L9R6K5_ASPWE|nr:uncharacterized protein ASPWEDRAFT_46160 [Aspergillus wentii DTO 134E9]OJJ30555.1 hypothetical protein ASPWEDRAFT_46160 [Aspergillus wentii DTO 134E9]